MSAGILNNKVNPNCQTNHLTLAEADRIMTVTGDLQILQSLAANHQCVVTFVGDTQEPAAAMTLLLRLGVAEGEFTRTLHDALADGIITGNEMTAIGNASVAEQAALIGLVARLRKAAATQVAP